MPLALTIVDENMIDNQSQCGNKGIDENESNHFLDPNLAYHI